MDGPMTDRRIRSTQKKGIVINNTSKKGTGKNFFPNFFSGMRGSHSLSQLHVNVERLAHGRCGTLIHIGAKNHDDAERTAFRYE